LAELERRGLAKNTVIIYTSDDGYFLGERGYADKWLMYDLSIKVPLIIFDLAGEACYATTLEDLRDCCRGWIRRLVEAQRRFRE
jgi:hypothetical protein